MSTVIPEAEKFAPSTTLVRAAKLLEIRGELAGEGASKGARVDACVTADDGRHRRPIQLTEKFAEGGEASLFRTDVDGHVAKIYKRDKLTEDRLSKLKVMIGRSTEGAGICFPVAILYNAADEFVGFLMPEARGVELGRSVFVPQLLLNKFPGWTRKDTIRLCITILEKIRYLNDRRIILGDINPANILVVSPSEVYFVDCDSYQIEGYTCPVGTAHFTAPEVGGKDLKTLLRTQEMENFAVATLLFMIMLPGKAPYSAVGGESPARNISTGNFPYPHLGEDSDATPPGKWGFIWSHMSYNVRLAFFESFKQGQKHFAPKQRYSTTDWIELFEKYLHGSIGMLKNDPIAMDIFPTRVKMKKCKTDGCDNRFIPNEVRYIPYCDECQATRPEFEAQRKRLDSERLRQQRDSERLRQQVASTARTQDLNSIYKTVQCRNPKCSAAIQILKRDRDRREPEYCEACWKDARCTRCSYVAKKWMHDERNGLCRRCSETASRPNATPSGQRPVTQLTPNRQKPSTNAAVTWTIAVTLAVIVLIVLVSLGGQ